MRDAVIVSTARTPIGKAYRGAFNATTPQALAAHAISHAVERAGVDTGEISDCIIGAALQQGYQGGNIARQSAVRAGLPVTVAGMSVDRQCASGMMAIATAAKQVITDGMDVVIGGGVESISMVQTPEMRVGPDPGSSKTNPTFTCRCLKPPKPSRRAILSAARCRMTTRCNHSSVPTPHRKRAGLIKRLCR